VSTRPFRFSAQFTVWCSAAVFLCLTAAGAFAQAKREPLPAVDKVRLAELRNILRNDSGNVVLVNAWATWCKPCQEEMPDLLKLREALGKEPFRLVLLSADDLDDLDTKVRPALGKFGVDFPTYIMSDSTEDAFITGMDSSWSGALPATFLYDRAGKRADMKVGERSYRQFEESVSKLLGK
jgi:thiol-disulfide isomerase/thioredoxin